MEGGSARVSRPVRSGEQAPQAQWLIARGGLAMSSEIRGYVQNLNLSFRIMERDSMDRLDAMSTFLGVVEAGSLSAAARQLKMPLTTISRKLSELESYLRTKLFNRSSRQLVLTDAGSSYLAACKRILTDVTEAPMDLIYLAVSALLRTMFGVALALSAGAEVRK
jgi:molybdenum-dependent DNA-binding transcriptional regulator ModE